MNESIIVGVALLILLGATAFYLYSRVAYTEKRLGLMESMLVDIKMTLEGMLQEEGDSGGAIPIRGGQPAPETISVLPQPGVPLEGDATVEVLPEESFYSAVLEQAHEGSGEGESAGVPSDAVPAAFTEPAAAALDALPTIPGETNYDSMSRSDLVTEAERRGLRVPKRTGRGELINLLRRSDADQNRSAQAGATAEAVEDAGATGENSGDMPGNVDQAEALGGAPLE
jgi:hypothetical protein